MAIVRADPFAPYRAIGMLGRGAYNILGPAAAEGARRVAGWVRNYDAAARFVGAPAARELAGEGIQRVKGWARNRARQTYENLTAPPPPPSAGPQVYRSASGGGSSMRSRGILERLTQQRFVPQVNAWLKKARAAYKKRGVSLGSGSKKRVVRGGVKKAKGTATTKGKKVVRASLKKARVPGRSKNTDALPSSFRLRNKDVRDRIYRVANYVGFMPGKGLLTNATGYTEGDNYMLCGWPLHVGHLTTFATIPWDTLTDRMRSFGQVLPLEIGLVPTTDLTGGAATATIGNHPTVFMLDMEKPPNNPHYSTEIPVPRFTDVGLGTSQSMAQIKMKRMQTVIEFGVQPFSIDSLPYNANNAGSTAITDTKNAGVSWLNFQNPAVTRNWHDEVRIVQLALHSDGELCDFDWTLRSNSQAAASKKWLASRFFDFDDYPHSTLYGDAGARLDFLAPVTGRYRSILPDEGCSEAFWKVDVLHDQVYPVSSSPAFGNDQGFTLAVAGNGYGPVDGGLGGSAGDTLVSSTVSHAVSAEYSRPVVPAGKSNIVTIDYPMDHGLFYSEKTCDEDIVNGHTTPALQVLHCENMQILTFIFSKNSISRPVATRAGLYNSGIPGYEAPNAVAWESTAASAPARAHRGDQGTVAAFFCAKVVKEFEIPDKV